MPKIWQNLFMKPQTFAPALLGERFRDKVDKISWVNGRDFYSGIALKYCCFRHLNL